MGALNGGNGWDSGIRGDGGDLSRAALAIDPETFRELGRDLVDRVASYLEGAGGGRVVPGGSADAVRAALGAGAGLPAEGADAGKLLSGAAELLFEHSVRYDHPRFFGYVISSAAPIGVLAELLAAGVNANVGAWSLSPMASEIEAQTVRWLAELVGYPTGGGGLLVSGGNMANITALLAARAAALGPEVRTGGVAGATGGVPEARGRVYATRETHTWLQKATDMAGLGTDCIRWVPTDAERRMDARALRRMLESDLEAGDRPIMVVATAGTVSTGAVDPLDEIGGVCRDCGVWFHVDGAYGAFAAAVPAAPADLVGMALADSLALDPHKWLYAPIEAGCLLVRDAARLRDAFSYHPPYYNFGDGPTNYYDLGPQNSRGFRALKVWLALRHAGRSGYEARIRRNMALAERLHRRVAAEPELEAVSHSLSITTFRYVPADLIPGSAADGAGADGAAEVGAADVGAAGEGAVGVGGAGSGIVDPEARAREEYLNVLNQRLLDRIQASGEAFLSQAVLEGRFVLRACIVNLHTTEADVDAIPAFVRRLGREVDGELRTRLGVREGAANAAA